MKLHVPESIDSRLRDWQKYRERRIMPVQLAAFRRDFGGMCKDLPEASQESVLMLLARCFQATF